MTRHAIWRTRWQRASIRDWVTALALALTVFVLIGVVAFAQVASINHAVLWLLRYPVVIAVAAGWIALAYASRQRRQSRIDAERSWLAAMPIAGNAFNASARQRMTLVVASGVGFATALLIALAAIAHLPSNAVISLALMMIMGAVLGAALGWWLARKPPRASRIRLRKLATRRASSRFALGRWPLRHSRAHADIGLHAKAIGALLLSLPIGIPARAVFGMLLFGLMALAIWDLARALLTTTMHAGQWLRSLPMSPRRAAGALGGSSLIAITCASVLLAVALIPSGMAFTTALSIVIGINTTMVIAYLVTCIAQQPFRAHR